MVVKKSLFKGKILYWIVLIVCLSLFLIPTYYFAKEPSDFVHDEYSDYEGKPVLNCNITKSELGPESANEEGVIYSKHKGKMCLVEKVPKESYFSVQHPVLHLLTIKWGMWIGILGMIVCLIPRKKNDSKEKEGKADEADRKGKQ